MLIMEKTINWINDKTIKCECGVIVSGNSKDHAKSNLDTHQKSKQHKKNMKLLSSVADKPKVKLRGVVREGTHSHNKKS